MKTGREIWQSTWRILLGGMLLTWVFHTIFFNQAERLVLEQGGPWESLSRWEKWQQAWQIGPLELWHTLTLIPLSWLILSVLLMGLTVLLGTIRWRAVLQVQGLNLSLARALEISFVAHFFNSFMLGSTGGDLMKAYYAARETRHKKTEAVVTVFVDRLLGLWAMLLFAGVMLLLNTQLLTTQARIRPLALIIMFMLLSCSVVLIIGFWGGVSKRWSGARSWLRHLPKGEWLERSLDSCRAFGNSVWFVPKIVGLSMILNAVCVLQVMAISRGLHLAIPSAALFAIVPMIICISAIPITPSGLGVRENLFVFMLAQAPFHVEATSALSLSLLAYAGSLFWSLVGGLVYVTFRDRHRLHEEELQKAPSS